MTTTTKEKSPKAAKPKPPAKTKAPAADAPTTLAPSNIVPIPFGRVKRAPENVRKTHIAADVESLADDIAAHGLLQSLIGYAGNTDIDRDVVWIVGGGRRLQALQMLRDRDIIDDQWPVSVLIRDQAEAIELSLSENLARRDMNPADEFEAFAALMKTGATNPAALGKRFGFTERYVKQRLRLADLAPEILEALREDKIGVESAVAYARTANTDLQMRVFKAQSKPNTWNPHNATSIRQAYDSEQMDTADTVFRFIDAATYEKEGGGYEDDLFATLDDSAPRKLTRGDLALQIAQRCATLQAERPLAAVRADHPSVAGFVFPTGFEYWGQLTAPEDHILIRQGWNNDLNQDIQMKDIWAKIDRLAVPAVIIIHLALEMHIPDDADEEEADRIRAEGTKPILKVDVGRIFVPKAHAKDVLPPRRDTSYGDNLTPEQREEAALQRDGRLWAARLAVPAISEIPGFEGRVFYDRDWLSSNSRKPGDPITAPYTPSFTIEIFVSEDEIAANMEAGLERARQVRDERERARLEREAAKEATAKAKADRFAAVVAEIKALPEPAAVIMCARWEDYDPAPFYRWADGNYFSLPEDHADAEEAEGFELDDLFDEMAEITGFHATREAYDAAKADAEPETEDA